MITTSLIVDRTGKITELGEGWSEEAEKGQAEKQLSEAHVVGHRLSEFIRDDTTAMYVDAWIRLCRVRKETLTRDYRCDSPSHKRFMRIELEPLEYGQVKMTHYLLREEPFNHALFFNDVTPSSASKTQHAYTLRCSMCNQIKLGAESDWTQPETLNESTQAEHTETVIHTICPICKELDWTRAKPTHSS